MTIKQHTLDVFKDPEKRIKFLTTTTMIYNFVWAVCKIVFGALMSAYLFCISGAYNILIGFAKKTFLSNRNRSVDKNTKSLVIGILILISGFVYAFYTASFFIWPKESDYGLILSIAIATCSFVELGLAIYNIMKAKQKKDILLFSLRSCNLATAAYAMVLTQIALLSATGTENVSNFNAITGIIAGTVAIAIASAVIIKSQEHKGLKSNRDDIHNNQKN